MSPQTNDLHAAMQWHLPWHKARVRFIAAFVLSLIKVTTVNLTRVANGLNGHADKRSNYRRIQRFFALFEMDYDLIAQLLFSLLPAKKNWIVTLDRTNWKFGQLNINILVAGILYQGIAIPLYWTLLDKRGNSNTQERIALMQALLKILDPSRIQAVVCDREFIGCQWFKWLDEQGLTYHLRIKENALLQGDKKEKAVRTLFGDLTLQQARILRKRRHIYGHAVYLAAVRLEDEYLIVASNRDPGQALKRYQKRWGIECLFSALKKRGFDFEQTHLVHLDRLKKLVALLALAFTWAHIVGEWITQHKPLKIKKHGYKEQSIFRAGLDHLQYILLNIQEHLEAFWDCVGLLIHPYEIRTD